eukprot:TRINITY_DN101399_c0_g1_i1.p1 TRINITY_DN101399_c0_g1~~TRINITY_DN101399_c0_g1_i1.p1  ORF type:complete len:437 (-),score=134.98 TRINITY_DN101399_c0_g1_i1:125-1435(-)
MAPGGRVGQDARAGGRQQTGKDGWVSNTKNGKAQGGRGGKPSAAKVQEGPKAADFVADLMGVLEPYGYDEAATLALVERCGCDATRIQEAVSNILDEKMGHEQGEWASQATASERKAQAAAAKERREQREKEIEEEIEKEKERRARAWDTREAEARKRAAAEDAMKKQARLAVVQGEASGGAPKTWKTTSATPSTPAPAVPPAAQAAAEPAAPVAEATEKSSAEADWNQWSQRYGGQQAAPAVEEPAVVEEAPAPAPARVATPEPAAQASAVVANAFDASEDSDFIIFPDYVKELLADKMSEPLVMFGTLNVPEPVAVSTGFVSNGASWIEQEDMPHGEEWEVNQEAWSGSKAAQEHKTSSYGDRDNGKGKGKGKKSGGKGKGRGDSWTTGEKGDKGSRSKGGSMPNGDNRPARKGGKGKFGKGEQGSGQKPREGK